MVNLTFISIYNIVILEMSLSRQLLALVLTTKLYTTCIENTHKYKLPTSNTKTNELALHKKNMQKRTNKKTLWRPSSDVYASGPPLTAKRTKIFDLVPTFHYFYDTS